MHQAALLDIVKICSGEVMTSTDSRAAQAVREEVQRRDQAIVGQRLIKSSAHARGSSGTKGRICVCVSDAEQAPKGHLVDALAPRGDEGRGTLRKVLGSWEQALIQERPNGETRPARVISV